MNQVLNITDNVLSNKDIKYYINKAAKGGTPDSWDKRTVDITKDKIVKKIEKHLNIKCLQAQIQSWVIGSESEPHIHNYNGREDTSINVTIYLNDNYNGGHFLMPNYNIDIKPKPGMMFTFDGSKIKHGLTRVSGSNRYDLIFWMKKNDS